MRVLLTNNESCHVGYRLTAVSEKDLREAQEASGSGHTSEKTSPRPSAPLAPIGTSSFSHRDSANDPPQEFPVLDGFPEAEQEDDELGMMSLFAE